MYFKYFSTSFHFYRILWIFLLEGSLVLDRILLHRLPLVYMDSLFNSQQMEELVNLTNVTCATCHFRFYVMFQQMIVFLLKLRCHDQVECYLWEQRWVRFVHLNFRLLYLESGKNIKHMQL